MATISLGKIAFSWQGAYDASTSYDSQDVVSYSGSSYICTQDGTSGQLPVSLVYANSNPATITKVVTVAQNTAATDNVFYIDGVENPVIDLVRGNTYVFDMSDATNSGHPLVFESGGSSYTTAVTVSGTEGTANATVTIVVPLTDIASFTYICSVHGAGMGNTFTFSSSASDTTYQEGTNWDVFAQGVESITTAANELIYYNGTQLVNLPAGTTNQVLQIGNSGSPEWVADTVRRGVRATKIQDSRQPMMYRRGCALMDDGSIRWWGRGEGYMLGQGNQTNDRSYPIRVGFPHDAPAMDYVCGQYDYQSIAIDVNGGLWVWGENDYGDVGRGDTSNTYTPFYSSGEVTNSIYGKTVVEYAPMTSNQNYCSTLVRCSDGTVHAAGYNGYGQLGAGDTTNRSNFTAVPLLADITKIARGAERYTHCLALKNDGTVYAWGYNNYGQLGMGNTTQLNIPMTISYFTTNSITIVDIGCGKHTSWAIDDAGNLYTWGYNGYGNLGRNGTTTNAVTYTPDIALSNVQYCVMSGLDYDMTSAIKTDGTLFATGDNSYGCLGVAADTTDRTTFQQCKRNGDTADNMVNIDKVLIGGTGSYNWQIALDTNGVAWSVGYSGNGQIGRGTSAGTNYWFYPVLLNKTITDIATVGTGSEGGTIFLTDDGSVYQCGYAGESQLPEDDDEYIQIPMPVVF